MSRRTARRVCPRPRLSLAVGCAVWLAPAAARAQGPELVLQVGHRGDVRALAFSPDAAIVASGGGDGRVLLWDVATGVVLRSLEPAHRVTSLAFAPDGPRLLIGRINCKAQIAGVDGASIAAEIEDRGGYCSAALSVDGRFFAFGGDELLRFADAANGKILCEITDPERDRYWDVAISPDRSLVVGASNDKVVTLWSTKDGSLRSRLRGHEAAVRRVWFDGQGRLVSADGAGAMLAWDLAEGRPVTRERIGAASSFGTLRVAVDGENLAFVDLDGALRVRRPGAPDRTLALPPEPELTAVALNAKADLLALGDAGGRVRIVRIADATTARTLEGSLASPRALAAASRGDLRVAVAAGDALTVLSLPSAARLFGVEAPGRKTFALAPDGATLAYAVAGGTVHLVDLATGERRQRPIKVPGPLAVGPGGMLAVYESAASIAIWRDGAEPVRRLPGNESTDILALAFSPDGLELAMSGKGNFIRCFDLARGDAVATRGGSGFARASDRTPAHDQGVGWVASLALSGSRAERRVLCGGPYSTLVLRDGALDSQRALEGHRGSIVAAAFLPNGGLATAGSEDAVLLWDGAAPQPVARIEFVGANDWIVRTPDGRFEATEGAMRRVHRVRYSPDHGFEVEPATDASTTRGLLAGLIGAAAR